MRLRKALDEVRPYHPPRMEWELAADRGANDYVKLTMNELSFGPLPEASAAAVEVLARGNRYPERDSAPLREAIAEANPGGDRYDQRPLVLHHRRQGLGHFAQDLRLDREHQNVRARSDRIVAGVGLYFKGPFHRFALRRIRVGQ